MHLSPVSTVRLISDGQLQAFFVLPYSQRPINGVCRDDVGELLTHIAANTSGWLTAESMSLGCKVSSFCVISLLFCKMLSSLLMISTPPPPLPTVFQQSCNEYITRAKCFVFFR
jgi:hypothetical protein